MFGNLLNPKKWTLGTIGDIAGLAGAGILGGAIPGSQALGAGLGLFGSVAGSSSQQPQYKESDLEKRLNFQTQRDLDFIDANSPRRYAAINNAVDSLDPVNDYLNAMYVQNQFMRNADMEGRRQGNMLRQKGYASSVGDAAELEARNNAVTQGNDYFTQLTNPMNRAGRYMQQAGLLGDTSMFNNSLSGFMGLQTQRNNQRLSDLYYENNRPATGIETALGLFGQYAPYLNQKKNFSDADKAYAGNIANGVIGAWM